MDHMFDGASAFNQDLGGWNIGHLAVDGDLGNYGAEAMLNGTALSTANYNALLGGLRAATIPSGISLGVARHRHSAGLPPPLDPS